MTGNEVRPTDVINGAPHKASRIGIIPVGESTFESEKTHRIPFSGLITHPPRPEEGPDIVTDFVRNEQHKCLELPDMFYYFVASSTSGTQAESTLRTWRVAAHAHNRLFRHQPHPDW